MIKQNIIARSIAYRNEQAIRKLVNMEDNVLHRNDPPARLLPFAKVKKTKKEIWRLFYKLSVSTLKELRP